MLVVKVGGGSALNHDLIADDVAELLRAGRKLVLIHGGAELTNEVATKLGHPPEFVTSPSGYTSRRTDRRTLEIFEMVYCGQLNKAWVERLHRRGVNAVGLSGLDGRLWEGPRKEAIKIVRDGRQIVLRDDYTGRVERVNSDLIRLLLQHGYLPVLTPPAISFKGEAINVDGDRAAAVTAGSLGADALILLTDVPGLLERFPDESTLIRKAHPSELDRLIELAGGRMKKKILGAKEALAAGVKRVIIADGRLPRPLHRALSGEGTLIGD
ncbi:[LysW]-aminoadipate kinase [bacterium HR33]|nr:[LysW]-aminoadipate kinase [bacterium HR33]